MGHRPERRRPNQLADLFERPPRRPRWPDLPPDTRRTVTALLAQLLGDRPSAAMAPRPEVEHE